MSPVVVSIGAICFGIVVGYVVYRSLARSGPTSSVSDIAAVTGAVGGGVVTTVFDPTNSDAFGYYSVGLLIGMVLYPIVVAIFGKKVAERTGGSVVLASDPTPEKIQSTVTTGHNSTPPQQPGRRIVDQ